MALIVYSGGLDSTVLLHYLAKQGRADGALWINYGQRHFKELECAKANCKKLGVKLDIADISTLAPLFGDNALTSKDVDVPTGEYDESNMKTTVVPNRNMIMIAIAAARAIAINTDSVAYAAHSGDHSIYPDCRPEFADALNNVLNLCHYTPIKLERPFVNMTKTDIIALGYKLGVDFDLTWSCYNGLDEPCHKCATCIERDQAFTQYFNSLNDEKSRR